MKRILMRTYGWLLAPIVAIMWLIMNSRQRALVAEDRDQWCRWLHIGGGFAGLCWLVANRDEFRSVLYRRMGAKRFIFNWWLRPLRDLYITTTDIGGGLLIQHGFSTIISAARIGRNCKIYHHVTLGFNHALEAPVLGDNVEVCCGAKIIGGVTVGDDVLVGAGALVTRDVPPNSVVACERANVIRHLDHMRDLTA